MLVTGVGRRHSFRLRLRFRKSDLDRLVTRFCFWRLFASADVTCRVCRGGGRCERRFLLVRGQHDVAGVDGVGREAVTSPFDALRVQLDPDNNKRTLMSSYYKYIYMYMLCHTVPLSEDGLAVDVGQRRTLRLPRPVDVEEKLDHRAPLHRPPPPTRLRSR